MPTSPYELHLARFAADPDDRAAFEFIEEHLFMQAHWQGLADLYRRRQAAPSLADRARLRAELAMRLGQVCEERLADAEAAIRAYTEAVRLDPTLRRALLQLRRIYANRRSWGAVLQISEQEAALAESPEERARVFAEMGDIWQRELGDAAQAEELYARARSETGGARTDDASDPLEATGAEPPLVQNAWLAAARGDTTGALAALERALERDPTDVEALDLMLTVLDGAERHAEMHGLLERRAALAGDPETRGAVLQRLGEIREQQGDISDAREAYERALAAHPTHAGARAALGRLYRSIEAWGALRSLLENAAESAQGAVRVELLYELAGVLEHELDDPEAAQESLDLARALAPDDPRLQPEPPQPDEPQASLTMPELDTEPFVGEQRSTRVVGVLERKLAACLARGAGQGAESVRLRLRIGELRGGALGEPAEAIKVLEPALESGAGLLEVAPTLAGLYEQLGRIEPLIDLAERAAALSEPCEQRTFWYRRAADAARAAGASERAIECYRRLLGDLPRDRSARAALGDLYRSRGEAEPLVELLREELARADAERELEIQLELASLVAEALGDPAGSVPHLRRCLELDPGREDLLDQALEACAQRGGPLAQLDLVEHTFEHADSSAVRASLLARRGALLADTLQWNEEAAESWRAALALDPGQALARERLGAV